MDDCGICDDDFSNDCQLDCRGVWGGSTEPDGCGVCGANGELCYDCAGVPFGDSVLDECGMCDDTNTTDCTLDCDGVWGGGEELWVAVVELEVVAVEGSPAGDKVRCWCSFSPDPEC